ncbi:MAG: efflux transporter outer membrane subunit [Desulfobacterales bacterium]
MWLYRLLVTVMLLMLPCACTVGPEYARPDTALTEEGAFQGGGEGVWKCVGEDDLNRWWRRMDDPLMDGYVDVLLSENLQLKQAAARIEQAWAQLGIAQGDRVPAVAASGSGTRRMQPLESVTAASGIPIPGGGDMRFYVTRLELGLSTSWQVDLFGKIRRRIDAAKERYLASRAEAGALVHSLIAELARRRTALATLKRRLELAEDTIASRKLTLETVEFRYSLGGPNITASDIYLARENLASVSAEVPDIQRQLFEQAYAMDVLLGYKPGTTDPMKTDIPLLPPPPKIPIALPGRLLDRRPDLQASELRMMAAVEEIGIAVADLYPDLTLSADLAFESSEANDFFQSENLAGGILADVMMRLFEGGRLRAAIDLQKARARELAADYAGQVLNALREVEVALSNERFLAERIEKLRIRLDNIIEAEREGWNYYKRGLRPLLEVLEIQRRRYAAEQAFLLASQAAWNNRLNLYLAIGGDWLEDEPVIRHYPLPTESGPS